MKTFKPMISAWGVAAGISWALLGTAPALAQSVSPAQAAPGASEEVVLRETANRAIATGADQDLVLSLVDRAEVQGISASVTAAWLERVIRVTNRDLPATPLLSRYLEGIAKRVPAARIDAAIDVLENRLQLAAQRVDAVYPAPTTPQEANARLAAIDHAAYALGLNGMSEGVLDRSLALASADANSLSELESPVLTLGILVASGIQAERSLEVVSVAWDHGYRGNDLERLGRAVGRLRHEGDAPNPDVVETVLKMIDSNASREEVFKGLDDLSGRDEYTSPGLAPGDDPTLRRGDTNRDLDPPAGSAPKDPAQPKPVGGHL